MDQSKYQVGQEVFILSPYGETNSSISTGIIEKVTPSGFVDVKFSGSGNVRRFRKDGYEVDSASLSVYRRYRIDDMPRAERESVIAEWKRKVEASKIIRAIEPTRSVNPHWSKESFLEEIKSLETQIANAKAAVEAI